MNLLHRPTSAKAYVVDTWSQIKDRAEALREFLDTNQGKFKTHKLGELYCMWETCYALHECQVHPLPYNFFVVATNVHCVQKTKSNPEGVVKPLNALSRFFFKQNPRKDGPQFRSRYIVNAEILESPEGVKKSVPQKDFGKNPDGTINIAFTKEDQILDNTIKIDEGCMSYARTKKQMKRFFRIKVRYQVPVFGILLTKTEWVEGLVAHIFQHEIDHGNGKNIYYDNK